MDFDVKCNKPYLIFSSSGTECLVVTVGFFLTSEENIYDWYFILYQFVFVVTAASDKIEQRVCKTFRKALVIRVTTIVNNQFVLRCYPLSIAQKSSPYTL